VGTPVAITVGRILGQVEGDNTGFLILPGDVKAMGVWIEQVLRDKQQRLALLNAAAAAAYRRFGLKRWQYSLLLRVVLYPLVIRKGNHVGTAFGFHRYPFLQPGPVH